jgi:hypothetical protein
MRARGLYHAPADILPKKPDSASVVHAYYDIRVTATSTIT